MKVFVLLCVVGAAFAVREPEVYTCTENPEPGHCLAYVPSYYYDPATGTCKKFIYGGCGGNGNRYPSEEACLKNCKGVRVEQAASDVCTLDKKPGMCLAYMPRYYYNRQTGKCELFIYGGCQGNGNNFATQKECETTCVPGVQAASDVCTLDKERGMCLAYMPRFYYNKQTGKCELFIYGGCQGNGNNFATQEECEATCAPAPQAALDRPDCDKPAETGLCKAYIPRYYYDKEAGQCKKFIYGGCGGNRNNFKTEDECYNKCGALLSPSTCDQPKKVGLCKAAFPRYYYNKETGQCEFFIYGGCGGNDNNFDKKEDCEAVCPVKAHRAPEHCHLEPETGVCRGYFPRYYFDAKSGECKTFIYGGCGGNKNNFETAEACEDSCSS